MSGEPFVGLSPFVGRAQELTQLGRWLHEAVDGHPRIVFVQGEAGIGKSRLLHELRSNATRLDMRVCAGRCYEDLVLPYLPFANSLLPLLEEVAVEPADRESIGQLLHRPDAASPTAPPSAAGQADHDKLRLFLAVGHAAVKLAQSCPTLVVIDDLHWADQLSLDLLDHLVFTVADVAMRERVPLVIIGTHRPVAAEDRLARLSARLQREAVCRTLTLEGLNELEVHELIGGLGLARPSHQLTATVSEATRGNPLFVQEVLHHLIREHALQEQGGYLVTTAAASDLQLPDEVMGAIVTRTRELSEACRTVLTLAAFLGDSVSVRVLGVVSHMSDDELLNVVDEGIRQRLLRSEGQTVQFAHPLVRHAFYNEPSPPRRQRLHRQIAESLQGLYAESLDAHVLEIAHHLLRAGPAAPAGVVADYARRAADQAFGVFAWGEAAFYYEAALSTAESTRPLSAQERGNLHYRAGLAHYYDQDVGPCLHHYEKAIEAYRLTGDTPGLARALMEKTRTHFTLATVPLGTLADVRPLEDVLAELGDREPGLRGHVAAVMAEAYRNGRQSEKAKERAQQALEIGRQQKDDYLCSYASFALGLGYVNDMRVREALASWQEALVYARRADDSIRAGWALHRIPLALHLLGRLDEAESVALEACRVTQTSHDWGNHSLGPSFLASIAAARGDFDLAERRAHETMLMVVRSRYPWGGFRSLLALTSARALRGAWGEAEDALGVLVEPGRVFEDAGSVIREFARVFRQLVRAQAQAAVEDLEPMTADLLKVVGTDTYSLAPLCALVELGDLTGAPAIAALPYDALARASDRGVLFSTGWMFLIPRVLGVAATAGREWDRAEAHFREAIEVATKVGARPELGRAHLDHARMLVARGDSGSRDRAIESVRQANQVFVDLGMHPSVRRATQLADTLGVRIPETTPQHPGYPDDLSEREVDVLLRMAQGHNGQEIAGDLVLRQTTVAGHMRNIFDKIKVGDEAAATQYAQAKGLTTRITHGQGPQGPVGAEGPRSLHIILVTDIAASSALIRRQGDAKAHDLMQIHNTLIRQCLAAHQGVEVTHTGDGIEASFSSASGAVDCAVAIQKAFARHNREHRDDAIHVRIGINAGEAIPTEGRLFGAAVHAAFRICARAHPGQILVSDVVAQLVAGKGVVLASRGRVALKGFDRIRLYEVPWED